jgi:hypothetical protein
MKDKKDEKHIQLMQNKDFDLLQYYIILFSKEGFHLDCGFWRLYWYTIKVKILLI